MRSAVRIHRAAARRAALALAVLLMAVGCTSASESDDAESGGPVEIEIWSHFGDAVDDFFRTALQDFTKQNPNVRINYQPVEGNVFRQRLLAAAATGEGPDIIYINPADVLVFVENDLLRPVPKDLFADELKATLGAVPTTKNGEPAVVYWAGDYHGFHYRTDFAKSAGWNKGLPRTWSELVDFCTTTVQRDGRGNITREGISWFPSEPQDYRYVFSQLFDALLQAQGSTLLNADATKTNLDTPQAAAAMGLIHDMIWKHKCSLPSSKVHRPPTQTHTPFYVGNSVAEWSTGGPSVGFITLGGTALRGKWDRSPWVPKPDDGGKDVVVGNGSGWGVTSLSDHPDTAFDALKHISSASVLVKLGTNPKLANVIYRSDVMALPEIKDFYAKYAPGADEFLASYADPAVKASTQRGIGTQAGFLEVSESFGESGIRAFEDPNLDIKAFLARAQKATDAALPK